MDTIDKATLTDVAEVLGALGPQTVHTVTVTLNGQHGGVDVTAERDSGPDLTFTVR